jgi:putative ABC transport system substrate-binding protein
MKRREFVTLLGGAALAWPLASSAQEAGRTYRVGGVSGSPRSAPFVTAMFDELRIAGFIEGQNLIVDWHQYGSRINTLSEIATELVKAKVDVIYAITRTSTSDCGGQHRQVAGAAAGEIRSGPLLISDIDRRS